jgi:5'-3' exonuclease
MGIDGLNPFLKKHAPSAFCRVKISGFRGTMIAIDAPLFLYASFTAAYSGHADRGMREADLLSDTPWTDEARGIARASVCRRAQTLSTDLMSHGITPLFVFDGTSVPEKTSGARARRTARREATDLRIRELRKQIVDVGDPLLRSRSDIAELRKLMRQSYPRPADDMPLIRAHIESLGVPNITAPNEAEKFCAYLSAVGMAAASWSIDTDSTPFGARMYVGGFSDPTPEESAAAAEADDLRKYGDLSDVGGPKPYAGRGAAATHFDAVVPPAAYAELGVTRTQLVDLCIMFSCDFNSRIPAFGVVRAYKVFSDVIAAEPGATRIVERAAALRPDLDWSILNVGRCRDIFLQDDDCREVAEQINPSEAFVYRGPRGDEPSPAARTVAAAAAAGGIVGVPPRRISFYGGDRKSASSGLRC